MLNAAKRHKELQSVKQAGNLVDISCENVTKEDSDLEMYDFGWVGRKILLLLNFESRSIEDIRFCQDSNVINNLQM